MTPDGEGIPCRYILLPFCGDASLARAVASFLLDSQMIAVKLGVTSVVDFTHDSGFTTCSTGMIPLASKSVIMSPIWKVASTVGACYERCCRKVLGHT